MNIIVFLGLIRHPETIIRYLMMQKSITILILLFLSTTTQAAGYLYSVGDLTGHNPTVYQELTVAESGKDQDRRDTGVDEEGKDEKKCMTICKKWGEDCIINPRTGTRDCRRMCKEFGEECF